MKRPIKRTLKWGYCYFATKSYPPPSAIFSLPFDDEIGKHFSDILLLKDKAVEAQKKYDQGTVFQYLRIRLGFTSNKIEGNSFSEDEVFKYLKTGNLIVMNSVKLSYTMNCHLLRQG